MDHEQLSLSFTPRPPEVGRARRRDPMTSATAARTLHVGGLHERIVRALRETGGLTIEELTRRLGRKEVSISPRLRELEKKQLVYRGATRANSTGREAIVWKALVTR